VRAGWRSALKTVDIESRQTIDEAIDRMNKALTERIAQVFESLDGFTISIPAITITITKPQFTPKPPAASAS